MTQVIIFRNGKHIYGFSADGHSGYAEEGSDIVCSAVSALTQTTLLGIIQTVGAEAVYKIDERGSIECRLTEKNPDKLEKSELLIKVMYEGLCNIKESYGKYLSVAEREVT